MISKEKRNPLEETFCTFKKRYIRKEDNDCLDCVPFLSEYCEDSFYYEGDTNEEIKEKFSLGEEKIKHEQEVRREGRYL